MPVLRLLRESPIALGSVACDRLGKKMRDPITSIFYLYNNEERSTSNSYLFVDTWRQSCTGGETIEVKAIEMSDLDEGCGG